MVINYTELIQVSLIWQYEWSRQAWFFSFFPRIKSLVCHSSHCSLPKTWPGELSSRGWLWAEQHSDPRDKHSLGASAPRPPYWEPQSGQGHTHLPPFQHQAAEPIPSGKTQTPFSKLNINQVRCLLTDGKGQEIESDLGDKSRGLHLPRPNLTITLPVTWCHLQKLWLMTGVRK